MMDILTAPWPWYVTGPLIGLTVPFLLILGNKTFGISSSLRHVCAACFPGNIPFFKYDWKKEQWNLLFAAGIFVGALLVTLFFANHAPIKINEKLAIELNGYGINDLTSLVPGDLFNWRTLFTPKGLLLTVAGGLLVGFGTRYAGGCTSGHSIMGLSNLQWPSLVATMSFMAGGFFMANVVLPAILKFL
jgi:uncharacterized membrane protein YedE/YeeE